MNLALPLSEDQRDCLQELTNVAIGAAAESLAELTNHFITLPIPQIRFVNTQNLLESFEQINTIELSTVVKQSCCVGEFDCLALLVVGDSSVQALADSVDPILADKNESDLIEMLYTTISDTCFDRLSEVLEVDIIQRDIEVPLRHAELKQIDMHDLIDTDKSISVEIDYHSESKPFNCHLMLVFPEHAITPLALSLDRLLN